MHGWQVVWIVRIVCPMRELVARVPLCRSSSQGPPCPPTATDERRKVRQGWGTLEEHGGDDSIMAVCVSRGHAWCRARVWWRLLPRGHEVR